jgi:uncharacterized protein (TIGR03089 family)
VTVVPAPRSVPDLLYAVLDREPSRPLVTHVGPDGARTELSVRTFENNVAKAANLLRDDADLQHGAAVALRLPLHWQTSVWLGATALVGGVAWVDGPADDAAVEVAVLGPDELDAGRAPLTLATALHPLGMPFREPLPAGVLDVATEVRGHPDFFARYDVIDPESPWLRIGPTRLTQAEALDEAAELAASLHVQPRSRVLVTTPLSGASAARAALAMLALPLVHDVAVVLLTDRDADLAAVAAREGCDVVLG